MAEPAEVLGGQLFLAHRYARAATNAALTRHQLELRHLSVLIRLSENEPMNQRQLVETLQLDKSSMVYIIDRLEELGLAQRRRDPNDRRSYAVHVTAAGRRRLAEARATATATIQELLQPFTAAEQRTLTALLARFIEHAAQ